VIPYEILIPDLSPARPQLRFNRRTGTTCRWTDESVERVVRVPSADPTTRRRRRLPRPIVKARRPGFPRPADPPLVYTFPFAPGSKPYSADWACATAVMPDGGENEHFDSQSGPHSSHRVSLIPKRCKSRDRTDRLDDAVWNVDRDAATECMKPLLRCGDGPGTRKAACGEGEGPTTAGIGAPVGLRR
jgi:hypothetical protein